MTQDNEFYELGLEINALENSSAPVNDPPEQNEPTIEQPLDQEEPFHEDLTGPESPASAETPDVGPPNEASDPLTAIRGQLEDLNRHFESKLKYDAHKNKIIDDLHQALQEYRQGLLQKYLQRVFVDVIKIIDDMRKFAAHPSQTSADEETHIKTLKFITNTAADLEDIFAWEGITPFTCDGESFDPSRQRVVDKIETDDPAKDKTIAARLRPGYAYEGRVLRSEMVNIYVFPNNHTPDDRKH